MHMHGWHSWHLLPAGSCSCAGLLCFLENCISKTLSYDSQAATVVTHDSRDHLNFRAVLFCLLPLPQVPARSPVPGKARKTNKCYEKSKKGKRYGTCLHMQLTLTKSQAGAARPASPTAWRRPLAPTADHRSETQSVPVTLPGIAM